MQACIMREHLLFYGANARVSHAIVAMSTSIFGMVVASLVSDEIPALKVN